GGRPGGQHLDDGVGERGRLVEVDVGGPVLDLDVDQVEAGAGVERGGQVGHLVGQRRPRRLDDGPAVGQVGVVVDREATVPGAAHVELDPVGPEGGRGAEGLERVLRGATGGAAVSDHVCHWQTPSLTVEK